MNEDPAFLFDNFKKFDDLFIGRRGTVWKLQVVVVDHLVNKIAPLVIRVVQSDDCCYFQFFASLYYHLRRQWLCLE